jgi:hypothetical protein
MNPNDILLLGLKQSVAAIHRADGSFLWKTKLPEGNGSSFITLTSDLKYVFAVCHGVLHCLELQTGTLVWTNPLKGYGFGIASLCLPGQSSEPPPAAAARRAADAAATTAASAAVVST